MRCKIPSIPMSSPVPHDGDMLLRDLQKKQKGKSDGDKHTRTDTIRVGDHVLLKQPKVNKLTTTFYSDPVEVIDRQGSTITVRHGGDLFVYMSSTRDPMYIQNQEHRTPGKRTTPLPQQSLKLTPFDRGTHLST